VANTFAEQAKERFRKSLAFMHKAQTLLQDDLVFRSALADAVSATKNMLQGYLLLRISAMPASAVTARWQEVAISNRMPDPLSACAEAGLNLHGLEREIQRLNNERNFRTHDDPQRLVDGDQALRAYELARTVQRRIKAAVQGGAAVEAVGAEPAPLRAAASGRLPAPVRAAVSGTLSTVARTMRSGTSAAAAEQARAGAAQAAGVAVDTTAATPSANGKSGKVGLVSGIEPDGREVEPASADDTYVALPALSGASRGGGRWSAPMRALLAVVVLLVGMAAGIGIAVPVATGHAPGWLGFATRLLPAATAAPSPTPPAIASPTPRDIPVILGDLVVTTTGCTAGVATLRLANIGSTPVSYGISTTDGSGRVTEATATVPPLAARFATLAAGMSATWTVQVARSGAVIVIVAQGGAALLPALVC
jgi:hypothetical protein